MQEYRQFLRALSFAADAVRKWALVTIAITIAFIVATFCQGCQAVQTGCMVIDAAHAACAVLTYRDALGREHRVELSSEELAYIGRAVEAQHGTKK